MPQTAGLKRGSGSHEGRAHVLLAMAATLAGRVSAAAKLDRPELAPVVEPRFELEEFVAEHNRNARASRAWRPSRRLGSIGPERGSGGQADGRSDWCDRGISSWSSEHLRPTNANIGSNDEQFWFWVQSDDDPSIYWCNYADLESSALAVTYQPDWIIEALGLKPITPEEAAEITVRAGPGPGLTSLTFPARGSGGQAYNRTMIVSDLTHRVNEFRSMRPTARRCWPRLP